MKGQFHKLENNKRKYTPRPRYMGKVLNWSNERNRGFVRCFDDGKSYFCHKNMIQSGEEYLEVGTIVNFELWNGKDREGNDSKYVADLLVVEVPEERHNKY